MGESTAAELRGASPGRMIDLATAEPVEPVELGERRLMLLPDVAPRILEYAPGLYERLAKPVIDRVLAFAIVMLALPVLLVIALSVKLTMGGHAVFRQPRVGLHGRIFTAYKFKTMIDDRRRWQRPHDGPDRRRRHKSESDPRVTRLGRVLRKWSLDELPQLFNVLRGDMSLVGPRPELVHIVEEHYEPWQLQRHQVKPGVTGLWQVSSRSDGLIYKNVDLDLDYIEQVSLTTDMRILMKTGGALLGRQPGF